MSPRSSGYENIENRLRSLESRGGSPENLSLFGRIIRGPKEIIKGVYHLIPFKKIVIPLLTIAGLSHMGLFRNPYVTGIVGQWPGTIAGGIEGGVTGLAGWAGGHIGTGAQNFANVANDILAGGGASGAGPTLNSNTPV